MSLKPKSADQAGDQRFRRTDTANQDKAVAEISMKDFLDFLKISYQVNESIENPSSEFCEKINVDWKSLTSDELISRLKEQEAARVNEKSGKIKNGSLPPSQQNTDGKIKNIKEVTRNSSSPRSSENVPEEKASEAAEKQESLSRQPSMQSVDKKLGVVKGKRQNNSKKKTSITKTDESFENDSSKYFEGTDDRAPAKVLKKKLSEVLQEGIFDSVLPYLLPRQHLPQENLKKAINSNDVKKSGNFERTSCTSAKEKLDQKKKNATAEVEVQNDKKDLEVVIHVCDEIKNLKRDFKCSQKLLVSQMGYFAEVTTGQKLEDMDISVHCDVTIFDWLMKWVQKDSLTQKHWPVLDSSIVIPVLMSSAFLQMDSLQDYCLRYCQTHINDIIRDSPNLSCINDNVLTRLANLFSNVEIENIIDKKDKIQSKLFCKLIVALTEPEPQPQKGHFSSIATMYRCSKCLKLILRHMSGLIHCVPSNMMMDKNGCTHSTHVYDSTWNLTDYVKDLKGNLKTWRNVYWRLWSDCHLMHCHTCEEYFPMHQMSWCRHHTEPVQYFSLENQKSMSYPVGRYSCCGERAYRFEVIKKVSGCHYRDHIPESKNASDVETLRIWSLFKNVIICEPPDMNSNTKCVKTTYNNGKKSPVKEGFWWEGFKLVPTKQTPGLLAKMWDTVTKKDESKSGANNVDKNQKSPIGKPLIHSQANIQEISSFSDSSDESCSSSIACNSEESFHSTSKPISKSKSSGSSNQYLASTRLSLIRKEKKKKKKKKKVLVVKAEENRFWVSKLSTRSNQDNQRDFEERALRQIELILAKKLSGESFRSAGSRSSYQVVPAGGIYVKLEQEWREAHCFSHGCPGSSIKARGSASYVQVNNNSFTIQKRSKSRGHR